MFDLAAITKGKIPDHVLKDEDFVACLPLLFRKTDTGEHYTKEELLRLAEDIKRDLGL